MGYLDGKVAIVTGAGRLRGIGRATAVALASEGADVVVTPLRLNYTTPEDPPVLVYLAHCSRVWSMWHNQADRSGDRNDAASDKCLRPLRCTR